MTYAEKISVLKTVDRVGIVLLIIACIMGYLRLIGIYYPIFVSDNSRLGYIKEQIANGKQIVDVEHLPNEDYLWTSMPYSGTIWEE